MDAKDFKISFSGLPEGNHDYQIKLSDDFLEENSIDEVHGLEVTVNMVLEKKQSFINLHFSLQGHVTLACDLCTELYQEPIAYKEMIVVKYGESTEDDPEDVLFISHNDTEVDVKHFLYEFISVVIPLKRVHKENAKCNQENMNFIHNFVGAEQKGEEIDPRWEALKKLKF